MSVADSIRQLENEIAALNVELNESQLAAPDISDSICPDRFMLAHQIRIKRLALSKFKKVGLPIFKIRNTRTLLYSTGRIPLNNNELRFTKNGKNWASEKLLKAHLLKCITSGINISKEWEVVKLVEEPVPAMSEWIDNQMLMEILKHQGDKK